MPTEKLYKQHDENKEWMSSLLFYKDEIKIMEQRLGEITSKNTSKEMLAAVEHFQNHLIISRLNLDELKHEINISNDLINAEIKQNGVAVDRRSIEDHAKLREEIAVFERSFKSLKAELNLLLAKWM